MLLNIIHYCYYSMMNANHVKKLIFLLYIPLLALFFSCSARIDGAVRDGGAAELRFQTALEPRAAALIRSLRGFMGGAADGPLLDAQAIARSLGSAAGIRSLSLNNTGPQALDGTISVSNIGDFLATSGAGSRFITFTEGRDSSSIVITVDRDSAPELIARLSPEAEEYLTALMAPAVLGERSTRQEYLSLVASVYGRPLADEIAAGRIRASIEFPRPVRSVLGGNAAGRTALFDIPLLDVLVLETPLRYEVRW